MTFCRGIVLLAVATTLSGPVCAQQTDARKVLDAFEKQLKETVKTAGPSIACIVVSHSEFYPKNPGADETRGKLGGFDLKEFLKADRSAKKVELAKHLDLSDPKTIPDHGFAGGVVIDEAGFILTPYHVIDGAKKVYVFLHGHSGSYADIHAADARSGLAVLKLQNPPPKLKPIKFAGVRTYSTREREATIAPGTLVVLMTNPYSPKFGVGPPIAGFGSITRVAARVSPEPTPRRMRGGAILPPRNRFTEFGTLLQYDVKMNAGVAGGVLLNLDGEMIGLTNAAAIAFDEEVSPGYAIPSDENFKRIVDVLRRGEEVEYGFLGVSLPNDPAAPPVVRPIAGGGAAMAGMRHGDLIVSVNDAPVPSCDDLQLHVGSALAGSKIEVAVVRGTRKVPLTVTLGKFHNTLPFIASTRPPPVFGMWVDYGQLMANTNDPRDPDPVLANGVCIREILPGSPADKQFQKLGDVPITAWLITSVNGTAVSTPAEFYKAAKGRDKITLSVTNPLAKPTFARELTIP